MNKIIFQILLENKTKDEDLTDLDTTFESTDISHIYPYSMILCDRPRLVFDFDDARTKDPHSSYYIPFFHYFGKSITSRVKTNKLKSKFNKNLRPKSTKSSRKLYF